MTTHPPRIRPELVADGPGGVWTWDITRLKGPVKKRLLRSVRHAGHLLPLHRALGDLADRERRTGQAFIERHHPQRRRSPGHDPRQASAAIQNVTALAELKIDQSHSRPRVSNDNPYSEANFKTLKYCPAFPERFGSIQHARDFCEGLRRILQSRAPPFRDRPAHTCLGHFGTANRIRATRTGAPRPPTQPTRAPQRPSPASAARQGVDQRADRPPSRPPRISRQPTQHDVCHRFDIYPTSTSSPGLRMAQQIRGRQPEPHPHHAGTGRPLHLPPPPTRRHNYLHTRPPTPWLQAA